jgi:hypothetical protein
MTTLLYDLYLLVTTTRNAFRVVRIQIDNTLILRDYKFKQLENEELLKAKLTAKPIKQLSYNTLLIFNGYILR